jgi:hypothetical protein
MKGDCQGDLKMGDGAHNRPIPGVLAIHYRLLFGSA